MDDKLFAALHKCVDAAHHLSKASSAAREVVDIVTFEDEPKPAQPSAHVVLLIVAMLAVVGAAMVFVPDGFDKSKVLPECTYPPTPAATGASAASAPAPLNMPCRPVHHDAPGEFAGRALWMWFLMWL